MKRRWKRHKFIEEWTLVPRALELLGNKTGPTRLGHAVLLKYVQREGQCPESVHAIPRDALRHLSQHVDIEPAALDVYNWQSRYVYHVIDPR